MYNNKSNISNYVNEYVQALQTMGLNVTNGTLLSLEELSVLCNTSVTPIFSSSFEFDTRQCPNYILETTYWLGNVYRGGVMWDALAYGEVIAIEYDNVYQNGVRPVITVSLF